MSTPRVGVLLLSFVVAEVTAYEYMDHPDFNDVFGAALHAGCKEPCDDSPVRFVNECWDKTGNPPCDETVFMENEIKYLKCTVGGELGTCDWSVDENQSKRTVTYRLAGETPCSDSGPLTWPFGDCEGAPEGAIYTPCVTDETWGQIILVSNDYPGRAICN